jgi:hypothetical protein
MYSSERFRAEKGVCLADRTAEDSNAGADSNDSAPYGAGATAVAEISIPEFGTLPGGKWIFQQQRRFISGFRRSVFCSRTRLVRISAGDYVSLATEIPQTTRLHNLQLRPNQDLL